MIVALPFAASPALPVSLLPRLPAAPWKFQPHPSTECNRGLKRNPLHHQPARGSAVNAAKCSFITPRTLSAVSAHSHPTRKFRRCPQADGFRIAREW